MRNTGIIYVRCQAVNSYILRRCYFVHALPRHVLYAADPGQGLITLLIATAKPRLHGYPP